MKNDSAGAIVRRLRLHLKEGVAMTAKNHAAEGRENLEETLKKMSSDQLRELRSKISRLDLAKGSPWPKT